MVIKICVGNYVGDIYHTIQNFIQIGLGVSVLRMCDFAPRKWLGYFFYYAHYTGDNVDMTLLTLIVCSLSNWLTGSVVSWSEVAQQALMRYVLSIFYIAILSLLFRLIILYSHVPDAFGLGMIIPVPKGDDCDLTSTDNYRAITISPCISKLFELC